MDPIVTLEAYPDLNLQYVFNLMQIYRGSLKFFQIEPRDTYNANHIRISTHVSIESLHAPTPDLSKITKENTLTRLRRFCIIIAFEESHRPEALTLKDLLLQLKCREVHLLPELYSFQVRYYFLCSTHREIRVPDFPNEILPGFLYLGSQEHAHNQTIVNTLKITHILNVTKCSENMFPDIKYCRVFVEDAETEKISYFFEKAYEFLEMAYIEYQKGVRFVVLVHCAKGVSRSATIVIMFLMRSSGMSLDEALEFVKKQRSIIEPNEGFMKELRVFEKKKMEFLRRKSSMRVLKTRVN